MPKEKTFVAVIGAGQASATETRLAEQVGAALAKKGAVVVCGGLGGIMEAACRGASINGGLTIGILPGDSHHDANPFVKIPVVTGIGYARNSIVVKSAQAVIAIGGRYGTLSEIAYALQSEIPVIGLGTWSLSKSGQKDNKIIAAATPDEAVETALKMAAGEKKGNAAD